MTIRNRLDRIAANLAGAGLDGWQPFDIDSDAAWSALCASLDVDPSDVIEEGGQSQMQALAELAGIELAELEAKLESQAADYEAGHVWQWIGGKPYVKDAD